MDAPCPVCGTALEQKTFPGKGVGPSGHPLQVEIDQCPSCEGMWFDAWEMEVTMGTRTSLLSLAQAAVGADSQMAAPGSDQPTPRSIDCVRGHGQMAVVTILEVEIDVCPACSGSWLDAGELKALHTAYKAWAVQDGNLIQCVRCSVFVNKANALFHNQGMICESCQLHADTDEMVDSAAQEQRYNRRGGFMNWLADKLWNVKLDD